MKSCVRSLIRFLSMVCSVSAFGTTLYVDVNGTNPQPPFSSWSTAATNIQDAADLASGGDQVLVADGTYRSGGRVVYGSLLNRVVLTNAVTLLSANGPQSTIIDGLGSTRCVFLGTNAILSGFTLTNGHATFTNGGGAWCSPGAIVTNCLVISNWASFSSYTGGGGVFGGTIYNSTLQGNAGYGGGARFSVLYNCVLRENLSVPSGLGGGAYACRLFDCIVSNNMARDYAAGGGTYNCILSNCVVTANHTSGPGGVSGNGAGTFGGTNYNCTITSNICEYFSGSGGGTYQSINYNCLIDGNVASAVGGGAYNGTNYNCIISRNTANESGGGAYWGSFYGCVIWNNSVTNATGGNGGGVDARVSSFSLFMNCTIAGNSAPVSAGGVNGGTLNNCILYSNSAPASPNYLGSKFNYSCSMPAFFSVITNDPRFVDLASGNLRLQSNSPCINSGTNSLAPGGVDLDGNPRIAGGTVDIGAYEFPNPGSILPYAWLQQFGLLMDGSADYADSDGDGASNWQEWRAGTNPTNSASLLAMLGVSNSFLGLTVFWQTVSSKTYSIECSTNLAALPPFSAIGTFYGATGSITNPGTASFTDPSATNSGPYFYRVRIQ